MASSYQYQLPVVYHKMFELADALGIQAINELPGAWIYPLDEQWMIAVNGHDTDVEIPPDDNRFGLTVPAFNIGIWYNGWPAGILSMNGGVLAAGEGANEDTLIAAFDAKITAVKAQQETGLVHGVANGAQESPAGGSLPSAAINLLAQEA